MNTVDVKHWKSFCIGKLFSVSRPAARLANNYLDGSVPFVASGKLNNGVVRYCEPRSTDVLDKSGCITVSPLDGYAFYQPYDFLGRGGAGSAIIILRNTHMNENIGLFVSTVLRTALTKFNYDDQINSQNIKKQLIPLPVDDNGEPDWDYMEDYMKRVMNDAWRTLTCLTRCV